jgi:hypothetical protein
MAYRDDNMLLDSKWPRVKGLAEDRNIWCEAGPKLADREG